MSVEAAQRGSAAFADQANACVSTCTIPLDPHERLGPAGATPGVGNLLKRRPGTPCTLCYSRGPLLLSVVA